MSLVRTIMENTGRYRTITNSSEDVVKGSSDWINATDGVPSNFIVKRVRKVFLPFLEASFLLRELEYEMRNKSCKTEMLLHTTQDNLVSSILKKNLDWRRVSRSKYGKGVSFSANASYAHRYSQGFNIDKSIIVTKVLIGTITSTNYALPMSTYHDTTRSNDCNVYVKYRDDEFLPKYVINYGGPWIPRRGRW